MKNDPQKKHPPEHPRPVPTITGPHQSLLFSIGKEDFKMELTDEEFDQIRNLLNGTITHK